MTSPARRHFLRQSAIEAARQETGPTAHANGYELMLLKLYEDKRRLKQVRSQERKANLKRQLLPEYAPWVAGVLAEGRGAQDVILMTVMIWRLDAGDIPGALAIARYALRYKLVPPNGFNRSTPYLIAEDVAESATRAHEAGQAVNIDHLMQTMELTDAEDMPDQVRAKLHKITGYVLREAGRSEQALNHLKRALQLHNGCGVKKDIERLERAIRNAASR
ncbi:phage terminase small subunit [Serratia fonticola]|uniref:Terminase endonuclease subunit n=1 Tax=Serratia fonticola TaxID=47917 RepID=A0AAW3WPK5_SERFO|nr:terminase endonuclease subunit [Serratia fonticola]MBC3212914.1 terminase endonuclease subunit [Serratia fonticola]NYA14478.1 terminase endonuclease subunit [Serratia fonticola]NYA34276.1 terminase endonuclease subunit [Serratia fonticola]